MYQSLGHKKSNRKTIANFSMCDVRPFPEQQKGFRGYYKIDGIVKTIENKRKSKSIFIFVFNIVPVKMMFILDKWKISGVNPCRSSDLPGRIRVHAKKIVVVVVSVLLIVWTFLLADFYFVLWNE